VRHAVHGVMSAFGTCYCLPACCFFLSMHMPWDVMGRAFCFVLTDGVLLRLLIANAHNHDNRFQDRVFFFDVYNASHHSDYHADNLHMKAMFYNALAHALFSKIV
jgi:hypothetical protein